MGNSQSIETFDPSHIRIYQKLLHISNHQTRVHMIQTLLAGTEYVHAARTAGIYSHLLAYVARVNSREQPQLLPGEAALHAMPAPLQKQLEQKILGTTAGQSHTNSIVTRTASQQSPSALVAKGKGNEKALSYFQNCLLVLGLEEEVALTDQALRTAYKKAAVRSHPRFQSDQPYRVVRLRAHRASFAARQHRARVSGPRQSQPRQALLRVGW